MINFIFHRLCSGLYVHRAKSISLYYAAQLAKNLDHNCRENYFSDYEQSYK